MSYWIVDGRKLTNEEYEELQRQEALAKQQAREEAQRLTQQLGEAYTALKEHLRLHQEIDQQVPDDRVLDRQIYLNLERNLERANQAPRCAAIKEGGTQCRSPKMKNHIYCYAHCQMLEARAKKLVLPNMEDANGIQMAIMLVQRALIDDEISEKKAGLLLYSIQIAAANVDKTTFGQTDEDMVTEAADEDDELREHAAAQRMRKMERRTSPPMNTDNTDGRDEISKILPQRVDTGGGGEVHANLG